MTRQERQAPRMRDSDVIYLAIKRLEEVARKMQRLEYDDKLDQMLAEAAEFFTWMTSEIQSRQEADS